MGTFQSIRNQTDVALSIAKLLFTTKYSEDKNVVFSPSSIHTVLSIIAAGSDGQTRNQLLTFLRCESTDYLNSLASKLASNVLRDSAPDVGGCPPCLRDNSSRHPDFSDSEGEAEGPCVCFANGVWVEQSFSLHHSFKQLLNTAYKATLASVDLQNKADEVIKEINLWAEEKTKGLIKDILSPGSLNSSTRLVFANSLYFKAAWQEKDSFGESSTKDGDFHILNGTSVKVSFMTDKGDRHICVCDGFKVLRLDYESGPDTHKFSMYIFLPDANDGLSALVEHLASESGFLEHRLPNQKVEVGDFRIPKFKFSFGVDLTDVLKEMGLVLPFSPYDADLTKMVDPLMCQENLYVSSIKHRSFISMNEQGTEAATVTYSDNMGFSLGCMYPKTEVDFVADHPFLFLIRERLSRTVFFVGQVLDPLHE
ncbi:serpin-ZX-like [Lotus japonicus]|uniref:serpin-ZX-like n=1 Tax=Lotus japonicus TaxID=34305 RepID=UPI002586DDA5|nr:serpin-ZX-like [Lotus japonicus]